MKKTILFSCLFQIKNKKIFILAIFELIQTICGIYIASCKTLIRLNIKITKKMERQEIENKILLLNKLKY